MHIKDLQSFELEFLNFVNSYVKNIGGKGPKSTEVRFVKDTIIYYLYGILTERERKLIQKPEGENLVVESRRVFLDLDRENRINQFQEFLNCEIIESYESWNLETDSAVGIFKLQEEIFG